VIKAVLICALFMAIGSYLVYLRTGTFWMPSFDLSGLKQSVKMGSPKMSTLPKLNELNESGRPVYKWIQNGRWHYGDTPPEGVKAQIISKGEN
jgi:TRAP-type C4-dicarboxylate transport system permease small subunit